MSDCEKLGDCPDARIAKIYDYLDGVLPEADINDIAEHLATCSDCAGEYDLECVIRSAVKRSCTENAPMTLKQSILSRIHQM